MPILVDKPELDDFSQSSFYQPNYEQPGLGETVQAAFRLNNTLGSYIAKQDALGQVNPNYNPIDAIKGTEFEPYATHFLDVGDEVQLENRKKQISQELKDRATLERSGWMGIASSLSAGVLDPVNLIPVFGIGNKITQAARAGKVLNAAGYGSITGAVGVGLAEVALQDSQQLATAEESMYAIATGAAFGGIVGGAIGQFTGKQLTDFKSFLGSSADVKPINFEVNVSDSAGAMRTEFKGTFKPTNIKTWTLNIPTAGIDAITSPAIRGLTSSSQVVRRLTSELLETHLRVDGLKGPAMETLLKNDAAQNIELARTLDKGYLDYLRVEPGKFADIRAGLAARQQGKLSYGDYQIEIGKAMRRGDKSDIPQVEASAAYMRTLINTKNAEMGKLNIAPFNEPLVLNAGDTSYLTRIYDTDKIIANRPGFEDAVFNYMRNNRSAAMADRITDLETNAVSRVREKLTGKGITGEELTKRLEAEQVKIDRQIAELKSRQAYFEGTGEKSAVSTDTKDEFGYLVDEDVELVARIRDTTDKIIKVGNGSVMDDVSRIALDDGVRFTKEKTLNVPDEIIEDFLISDAGRIVDSYVSQANRMMRMKQVLNREGVDSITELKAKIKTELDEAYSKNPQEYEGLFKDYQKNSQFLNDVVDMSMERIAVRSTGDTALKYLRHYNYLTMLGGMTISAIPDIAMPILKHGFRETASAWKTFAKAGVEMRTAVREDLHDMGVAVETVMNDVLRSFSLSMKSGRFDESSDAVGRYFGKATLMTQWNTMHKEIAAVAAESRIFRNMYYLEHIEKSDFDSLVASGIDKRTAKTAARDADYLRELGIDNQMIKRVLGQFKRFGSEQKGAYVLNTKNWTDREAADIIRAAVVKEVDSTIITPDKGSIPIGVAKHSLVKTIFQFKSFVASMMSKALLPALQRKDKFALQGVISLISLGALSYHVVSAIGGREPSKDMGVLLKEGLSRSGMFGLVMDPLFGIAFGSSRYMNNTALGLVAGPTGSVVSNASRAINSLFGTIKEPDKAGNHLAELGNSLYRMTPFLSLFYIKFLLNQNEKTQGGKI